ncbi:MAG: hypothetical protein QXP36_02470, partial [Conexivisphaerales archaeon]
MYKRLIAIVIILGMFSSLFSSSISNVKGYSSLADFVNSIKPATSSSSFSDGNFYAYLKVANGKNVLFAWVKGSGSIYVYEYSNNAWTVKSTINGVLPGSEQTQILSYPVKLLSTSSGPLSVTISGNDFVNIGDVEEYNVNILGGVAPYNVSWSCNLSSPASGSATVPSSFTIPLIFNQYGFATINVSVTDAHGSVASATFDVNAIYVNLFDSGKAGILLMQGILHNLFTDSNFFALDVGGFSVPSSVTLNSQAYSFSTLFQSEGSFTKTVNSVNITYTRFVFTSSSDTYINLGDNVLSFLVVGPSGKSKTYSFHFVGNVYSCPVYALRWTYSTYSSGEPQFIVPIYVDDPSTGGFKRFDYTVDDPSDLSNRFDQFYQEHADWIQTSLDLAKQGQGLYTSQITIANADADSTEVFSMGSNDVNQTAFAIAKFVTVDNTRIYYPYYEVASYSSISQVQKRVASYNAYADFLYDGSPFTVKSSNPNAIAVEKIAKIIPNSPYASASCVRISAPTVVTFDYTGQGAVDAKVANICIINADSESSTALEQVSVFYPSNVNLFPTIITYPSNTTLSYYRRSSLFLLPTFSFIDVVTLVNWVYPQSFDVTVNGWTHIDVIGRLSDNTYLYPTIQSRDTPDYTIAPEKVGFNFIPKRIGRFSVTFSELDHPFTMQFNVVSLGNSPIIMVNDGKGSIKVIKSGSSIYGNALHYYIYDSVYSYYNYNYYEYMFNDSTFVSNIVGSYLSNYTNYKSTNLTSSYFIPGNVDISVSSGYQGTVKFVFDFDGIHDEVTVPQGNAYSKSYTLWKNSYISNEFVQLMNNVRQRNLIADSMVKPYTLTVFYSPDGV